MRLCQSSVGASLRGRPRRWNTDRRSTLINGYLLKCNLRHAGGARTSKTASDESRIESTARRRYQAASPDHGPNRCRYSIDVINALTISASMKFPLN